MIRTTLSLAILTAIALSAFAADPAPTGKRLYMVAPTPILVKKAATPPVAPAGIMLSASTLPDGMDGVNYNFDLKTLTAVTGGTGSIANATFGLGGGTLPAGLSLSNEGVLAGKPTAVTAPEGKDFTVTGSYQSATGQQVYTIKVGEAVLQVLSIAAGGNHTCAVTTAGAAQCWGNNYDGQLGNGSATFSSTPMGVTGLGAGVASISVGDGRTCAVTTAGAVKCWGNNGKGQLGNGSNTNSSTPVPVTGLDAGVVSIAAGMGHTCAVTTAGAAKCWGGNYSGQLGNGSATDSNTPVDVTGLAAGVASIAAGSGHTCAVTTAGATKCWGVNYSGQLGNGSTTASTTPVDVSGLAEGVASISVGGSHTCAVTTAGQAKCWGFNIFGQLGNGSTTDRNTPVNVTGLGAGVASIAAGDGHTCVFTAAGAVKCWGLNYYGQLGSATNSTTPVDVSGLAAAGVANISAGSNHTCAVTTAGAAKCWGDNSNGQLGDGSTTQSPTPVNVKRGS